MKKIDRLILSELIGPWAFGVGIFTVLILAGSFLFDFTRFLSQGASPMQTVWFLGLLIPGVVVKTFSMAMLLSTLLAFGRLSGDSEIVALRAAGVSVPRIMMPVAVFGVVVATAAFLIGDYVVPGASLEAMRQKLDITKKLEGKKTVATTLAIYDKGQLKGFIGAENFDISRQVLTNAVIILVNPATGPTAYMTANELKYQGEQNWRIFGGELIRPEGGGALSFEEAWPVGVDAPKFSPEDLLAQTLRDLDVFSMETMREQIQRQKENPEADAKQLANLEFGYWNKIALPLAALVFGLVGAPLGIRNHRSGVAAGFWLSVIIIFCYLMMTNALSIMAQSGLIPSAAASFIPIAIGLATGGVLIWQRNR